MGFSRVAVRAPRMAYGLTAAAGIALAVLSGASAAHAGYYDYCEQVVDPQQRCPYHTATNTMTVNYAVQTNEFIASISVCERVENNSTGGLYSRRCDTRRVDSASDLNGPWSQGITMRAWAGNNSGSVRTTIRGSVATST